MNASAQPAFSFFLSPGLQSTEWCHLQWEGLTPDLLVCPEAHLPGDSSRIKLTSKLTITHTYPPNFLLNWHGVSLASPHGRHTRGLSAPAVWSDIWMRFLSWTSLLKHLIRLIGPQPAPYFRNSQLSDWWLHSILNCMLTGVKWYWFERGQFIKIAELCLRSSRL